MHAFTFGLAAPPLLHKLPAVPCKPADMTFAVLLAPLADRHPCVCSPPEAQHWDGHAQHAAVPDSAESQAAEVLASPRSPLYISSADAELEYGQLLGSSSQPQQGQAQGTALTVWRSGMSAQEEDLQQVGFRLAALYVSSSRLHFRACQDCNFVASLPLKGAAPLQLRFIIAQIEWATF